jgi:DNA-directed RNA polymerase subunit M/transcription elongation factor TFIIS
MEHAYRDWTRAKLGEFLGTGALARNCERNILNWTVKNVSRAEATWESKIFRIKYKMKAIWLVEEFKRGPQLANRLKSKELESTKLSWYPPDVLNPNGPYSEAMLKIKTRDNRMEALKALEDEDYVGQFKCGKCKSVKTTYYQLQTRSADEPSALFYSLVIFFRLTLFSVTTYVTCLGCNSHWKC